MSSFTKREQIVILVIVFIVLSALGFKFFIKDMINSKNTLDLTTIDAINNLENDLGELNLDNSGIIMVHISGEVFKPGLVELKQGDRVKDAVSMAGGLKKDADLDRINLAKKVEDEEKIYIPKIGEEVDIDVELPLYTSEVKSNKININLCSLEELINLPGIGEVIGKRIIDYRKSNPFKSIEEIKNVSGIGDKKFNGIKDLITVKWKGDNFG